ncbi:MAG: hypothetical protein ACK5D5_09080 [Bacteroidota bacterium]
MQTIYKTTINNFKPDPVKFKIYKSAIELEIMFLKSTEKGTNKNITTKNQILNKNYISLLNRAMISNEELLNNYIELSELLINEVVNFQKKDSNSLEKNESLAKINFLENQIDISIKISKSFMKLIQSKFETSKIKSPRKSTINHFNNKELISKWWLSVE